MLFFDHIRSAVQSLSNTRLRTLLTTVGIAIGIASITSILALAGGVTNTISTQVTKLDSNIAIVQTGAPAEESLTSLTSLSNKTPQAANTLSEKDLESIQDTPGVTDAAPMMIVNGIVRLGADPSHAAPKSTIIATTPELEKVIPLPIRDGQFIDRTTNSNTAVIGHQLSVDLFGTDQPIGQTFTIRGESFTVIGILKALHNPINYNAIDFDYAAIINLSSGKALHHDIADIYQINFRAETADELPGVVKEATASILANHGGDQDFTVLSGDNIAQPKSAIFHAIATVMAIIATISLVVGGVGIMNIMLVSVAERTREVGLRKSVGASNSDIVWQFMIEAFILSILGGALGYVLGYIVAFSVSTALPFTPVFTWEILVTAAAMSVVVGGVFGIYPAIKAARKDPIESLRQYH